MVGVSCGIIRLKCRLMKIWGIAFLYLYVFHGKTNSRILHFWAYIGQVF